jgi:2-keto-3-deoxy-6-phosphogluconate aldolase
LSSPSEPTKSPLDLALVVPVVPVVSVDHVEDAIHIARALVTGGLR